MDRQPIHVLVYSPPGGGKSTFFSTFPKPLLVWCFDPIGKETPYLRLGKVGEMQQVEGSYRYRDVFGEDGGVVCRVEYFHDSFGGKAVELVEKEGKKEAYHVASYEPTAYAQFLTRMANFAAEREYWKTVVLDSVTFMELAARKWEQYALNREAADPRQWWAKSTDHLEEMLMIRFAGLECNVGVACHLDQDKDEVFGLYVRKPAVPGRLAGRLAAAFQEVYRAFVGVTPEGQRFYALQTQMDAQFFAQSQLGAQNPCYPSYESLWGEGR